MELMKESNLECLSEIARFESSHDMEKEFRIGWSWRHVRIWPATLSRLFKEGYLENVFRSNSYTGYRLTDLGRAALTAAATDAPSETKPEPAPKVPGGLFADIIGHDDVKELLWACLVAEKPVHVLLAGPPALAKSLFLWDIESVCGEKAVWGWWAPPHRRQACGTWWPSGSRTSFSSMSWTR